MHECDENSTNERSTHVERPHSANVSTWTWEVLHISHLDDTQTPNARQYKSIRESSEPHLPAMRVSQSLTVSWNIGNDLVGDFRKISSAASIFGEDCCPSRHNSVQNRHDWVSSRIATGFLLQNLERKKFWLCTSRSTPEAVLCPELTAFTSSSWCTWDFRPI